MTRGRKCKSCWCITTKNTRIHFSYSWALGLRWMEGENALHTVFLSNVWCKWIVTTNLTKWIEKKIFMLIFMFYFVGCSREKKLYILIKCVGWCFAVNLLHLSNHLLLVYLCPPVANVVVSCENEGEERW